jgi:hypothetical protein
MFLKHQDTKKFEPVSIFLKLNKPDKKKRTEIALKLPEKNKPGDEKKN